MKVISTVPSMYQKLIAREKQIRVSVVGAGEFGRQVVTQISYVPNMEIVGVADHDLETAVSALLMSGYKEDEICRAETLEEAKQAVENGKKVAVRDAMMLCELPADALCDCTGSPPFGAKFAYEGIIRKKHLIVINIESTVSVGCALSRIAQENGVVYTTADGDQPSLIAGLYEWAKCLGREVDEHKNERRERPYAKANKDRIRRRLEESGRNVLCCKHHGACSRRKGDALPESDLRPDTFHL